MAATLESVPPVFIKDKDLKDTTVTPIQMCNAIVKVIHATKLEGVQKVYNLWRIYIKDKATRLELCVKESIVVNGHRVTLYDKNPNVMYAENRETKTLDKLTIKHLPLSLSSTEVEKALQGQNVTLASKVRYGCVRDENGQLTSYKSGDRYVYVQKFDPPLPKQQSIANFKCVIIHHGKENPCSACGVSGHRIGDSTCRAKPNETILAFKSYQHPLSNHYACDLNVFGSSFKSVEHAYLWRMTMELGNEMLAEEIRSAAHAGAAKRLSKSIAEASERWRWEEDNLDIMQQILQAKLQQCEAFRHCLLENRDKVLAEATPSKLWGSGLSPYATEHTAPDYWPGRNLLGAMLRDLVSQLSSARHTEEPTTPQSQPSSARPTEGPEGPVPQSQLSSTSHTEEPATPVDRVPERTQREEDQAEEVTKSVDAQHSATSVRGRPQQRTPPQKSRDRAQSTPNRKTGHSVPGTVDIRTLLVDNKKRKTLASSPDQYVQEKSQGKIAKCDQGVS